MFNAIELLKQNIFQWTLITHYYYPLILRLPKSTSLFLFLACSLLAHVVIVVLLAQHVEFSKDDQILQDKKTLNALPRLKSYLIEKPKPPIKKTDPFKVIAEQSENARIVSELDLEENPPAISNPQTKTPEPLPTKQIIPERAENFTNQPIKQGLRESVKASLLKMQRSSYDAFVETESKNKQKANLHKPVESAVFSKEYELLKTHEITRVNCDNAGAKFTTIISGLTGGNLQCSSPPNFQQYIDKYMKVNEKDNEQ